MNEENAKVGDEGPIHSVLEIELAVERDHVTFPMVMKALYLQYRDHSETMRAKYKALYPQALSKFMDAHGSISESFYCGDFTAGTLITGADDLFFVIWWDEFKFQTALARGFESDLNDLRLKAGLYLSKDHYRICMQRLFRLYKGLISSLRVEYLRWWDVDPGENGNEPHGEHAADIEQLRREFKCVEETYRRAGNARGQARYVTGAALGTLMIVAVAGTAAAFLGATDHLIWLGAIAGGAIGALLSVLQRMTRGALNVRFEAERLDISGVSRPVVGMLSGVALFVLIEGGLVPFSAGTNGLERGLFFAGIAFLAGFSERFAKDVIGNAADSLSNTSKNAGGQGRGDVDRDSRSASDNVPG